MTDQELIDELRFMGIDKASYRVVTLLPLVRVAWADGAVQDAERALILKIAEDHGMFAADGARILAEWLRHAPTEGYVQRGSNCLRALTERSGAIAGEDMSPSTLVDVVTQCQQVAEAAGGLFGILWTVDERERAAIEEIARTLRG
jgi:hypothetical protein